MVLGGHEVNARREARGEAPINSVWFWGEGAAPSTATKPYARIHSDDAFVRGLARLSGATLAPAASAASAIEATAGPVLATLDGLVTPWHRGDAEAWKDEAANLDRAWFGELGDAIKRFGEVRIILPSESGTRVASLTSASRWRWFRASRPLAHA